jgi:hypothetical protein
LVIKKDLLLIQTNFNDETDHKLSGITNNKCDSL